MKKVTIEVGGRDLILETGRMAKQANGSVVASYGGSVVLVTACCGKEPVEGLDYVPLQVEYNEKYYAAGKIPGGFLKREARPKDKEILVSRLIDRPLRPLFHKPFGREIQVVPTVVSTDQINTPDVVAMIGASAAVTISDIPFDGPVAAVRMGYVDGKMVVNPTFQEIEQGDMDIVVAGTSYGITMVEGGGKEVSEDLMIEAIGIAEVEIKKICEAITQFQQEVGKEKLPLVTPTITFAKKDEIIAFATPKMEVAAFVKGKFERGAAVKQVKEEAKAAFAADITEENGKLVDAILSEVESTVVRTSILEKGVRTDGRKTTEIRPITCEIDVLPNTHGSALFTRGETQSLAVTTLGSIQDEQIIDNIDSDKRYENFMLHYNFPPYSVGECGRMGTGRREIGHGHLAFRALENMIPSKEKFPYTTRVVSEILESNGSSSMATVCGGTLALLSAGVPMPRPVAGIAMGLVSQEDKYVVLSDILGEEDHLGDMDFKVTGTEKGITAFQMDIKISGVSKELMETALKQAHDGRMHILSIMNSTINTARDHVADSAPQVCSFKIDTDKIGAVIGTGGKTIKGINEKTGVDINIADDGTVTLFGKPKSAVDEAKDIINSLVSEPEVGRIYQGTVKKIMDYGAFIEIIPGKEGLCHISKLARHRVQKVSDILQEGQVVPVKLVEVDRVGRINLSYVDAIEE